MRTAPSIAIAFTFAAAFAGQSGAAPQPNRTAPTTNLAAPGSAAAPNFSAAPTAPEIAAYRIFAEPLVPLSGAEPIAAAENAALAEAVAALHRSRQSLVPSDFHEADLSGFTRFLESYPQSRWAAAIHANLGIEFYKQGRFSKALAAWEKAWDLGKGDPSPAIRPTIDRALAELARMRARLGMMDAIAALAAEAGDRELLGASREIFLNAREGLWQMQHQPGESFKCGPFALEGVLAALDPHHPGRAAAVAFPSTQQGTSLRQLTELAANVGASATPARRLAADTQIPVPCVVHWKLGHYGALLERRGARYLLQDPTFGARQWVEQAVIDEEASGHFLLVAADPEAAPALPDGWERLGEAEAGAVWGKGDTGGGNSGGTGGGDSSGGGNGGDDDDDPCKDSGMARWTVLLMLPSLKITDTPVGYDPPAGPRIDFRVTYAQREANQPATLNYANLGSRWNLNWITTLTFDSNNAYLHAGTGGTSTFSNFAAAAQTSAPDPMTSSRIERVSAAEYRQHFPDGSVNVFDVSDPSGRFFLTEMIDRRGTGVALAYDAQFRLVSVTDALGQVSTLSYDRPGDPLKITGVTDAFGRQAMFEYNGSGMLTRITDAVGMTSEFAYGPGDTINTLTTGYGATTFASADLVAGPDLLSRTLEATYPDGSKERWEAFFSASPIAGAEPPALVPAGMPTRNEFLEYRNTFYWDRKGMKDAPGDYEKAHIYHFQHDNGNLTLTGRLLESEKPPLENRIWYHYKDQAAPSFPAIDTPNLRTHIGRVLGDGRTELRRYDYNAQGNLIADIDPVGRRTLFFYDPSGTRLESSSIAAGGGVQRLSTAIYDGDDRLTSVAGPDGGAVAFSYDAEGRVSGVTNARGDTTTLTYDASGYITGVDGPMAGESGALTLTYDAAGRIGSTTDGYGHTLAYSYDDLDRLTAITYPDASSVSVEYTLLDITAYTDRRGNDVRYTYDPLGQLRSVEDPLGGVTRYDYCRCGGLRAMTDALGRVTRWTYDLRGRQTSKVFPDGTGERYTYDAAGRLTSAVDARGSAQLFQHDLDGRPTGITYTGSADPAPSVRLEWDREFPRLARAIDGFGATAFSYHRLETSPAGNGGLLAAERSPIARVDYTYDALRRVAARQIGAAEWTYAYDALGRPTQRGGPPGNATITHDAGSPDFLIELANGGTTEFTHRGINNDLRVEAITHRLPGDAPLAAFGYGYDPDGNITAWDQSRDGGAARTWTPTYDDADRLTGVAISNPAQSFAYAYDAAGNRLVENIGGAETFAAFNSLNELTALTPPSATGSRSLRWDNAGRLAGIEYGPGESTRFAYDWAGRPAQITEIAGGTVQQVRRLIWDGFQVVEERDESGAAIKRFTEDGVQIVAGPDAGAYFYARDHNGSVRELVDGAGQVRARYDYDPYGRREKIAGDLDADLGFTGHLFHARSGYSIAPARFYDPETGRWLGRDPIGERGGPNLFAYVFANPLNFVDPDGRQGASSSGGNSGSGASGSSGSGGFGDVAFNTARNFFRVLDHFIDGWRRSNPDFAKQMWDHRPPGTEDKLVPPGYVYVAEIDECGRFVGYVLIKWPQ